MNWIILNNRRYVISPVSLNGEYRLMVPGERTRVSLNRGQLERAVRDSLGLSGKTQLKNPHSEVTRSAA